MLSREFPAEEHSYDESIEAAAVFMGIVIFLNMQQFLIEAAQGKATEYLEQKVLEEFNKHHSWIERLEK